jgi:hypothetical protein
MLMHNDVESQTQPQEWDHYISRLRSSGSFGGGSSIGKGIGFKKGTASEAISHWLGGYMILTAETLDDAKALVEGNPVLLHGGTVEVRDLPRS